jgi:ABC-type sugar transport system ATPase subunit
VLSVRGLTSGPLAGVGLTLRAGEILGLWGLLGSGRTEIMRALVGLDPIDAGEIRLRRGNGLERTTPAALHAEVGFVTEDRRGEGLLLPLSVAANIAYANLDKVTNRVGLIAPQRQRRFAEELVQRVGVLLKTVAQPVRTLSGGNQQKVVLARWLGTAPRIFFLDEPVRGLDVGAKTEILRKTVELAEGGAAVLIACSEPEELMRVCDRYLVVQRGRIVGELPGDASKAELMAAVSEPTDARVDA